MRATHDLAAWACGSIGRRGVSGGIFIRFGPKVYFPLVGEEGGSGRVQLGRLDVGKRRKRIYLALRMRGRYRRLLL